MHHAGPPFRESADFPEDLPADFPEPPFVGWTQRKAFCADLRRVYAAPTEDAALAELEVTWGKSHPMAVAPWRRNWERVRPFFAFPTDVRRILYTTNAIESLNYTLRKIIKTKGHFPTDDAATKLLFLALRNAEKKWSTSPKMWKSALNQFAIHFEGRLPT